MRRPFRFRPSAFRSVQQFVLEHQHGIVGADGRAEQPDTRVVRGGRGDNLQPGGRQQVRLDVPIL